MNERPRIGVFYSKGRTFLDVLKAVRAHDPDARLCIVFPEAYPISGDELALADETLQSGSVRYGMRNLPGFLGFIRRVRRARYDAFVILFDTPRQRILASLSGADRRMHCRLDGKVAVLDYTLPGIAADAVLRGLWGRIVYACLWVLVRATRAKRR